MKSLQEYAFPQVGTAIVLGSGHEFDTNPYRKIKFVKFTDFLHSVHKSKFTPTDGGTFFETGSGAKFLVFNRRLHLYQGFSHLDSVLPIRIAARSGVRKILLVNSSGGINPDLNIGDLAIISDQLILSPDLDFNPDFAVIPQEIRESPYDAELTSFLSRIMEMIQGKLITGIYAFVTGPAYETHAEIRFLKNLGADLVGMSTALEAVYAKLSGIPVAGLSLVTNVHSMQGHNPLSHHDVLSAAEKSNSILGKIIDEFLNEL